MPQRTIGEVMREAVEKRDAAKAGALADLLRGKGLTYRDIYALAHRVAGISEADWEALMYESEVA